MPGPIDSSIKLFSLCEGMKWTHLPMAGGLYDQHPGLMDRFYYILSERAKEQERENKKKSNQMGGNTPNIRNPSRPAISRPRR